MSYKNIKKTKKNLSEIEIVFKISKRPFTICKVPIIFTNVVPESVKRVHFVQQYPKNTIQKIKGSRELSNLLRINFFQTHYKCVEVLQSPSSVSTSFSKNFSTPRSGSVKGWSVSITTLLLQDW